MEPLSVLTVVGATLRTIFTVSQSIYTFIDAIKKVDKSLENLDREIKGLNKVLHEIEKSLPRPNSSASKFVNNWSLVQYATDDTLRTVSDLHRVLDRLGPPEKVKSGFKKAVKQVELNYKADEIQAIRSRIQWHAASLQLALQTVSLQVKKDFVPWNLTDFNLALLPAKPTITL